MDVNYHFENNILNLDRYESFIANKIISNYPIKKLSYICNSWTIQEFDLTLLDQIYKIKLETDMGEYEYNLKPLMLQPYMNRKHSRLVIESGTISINADIYGEVIEDGDTDVILDVFDVRSYSTEACCTKCYIVNTTEFYLLFNDDHAESQVDGLIYDGTILTNFNYDKINNKCYKYTVTKSGLTLNITSLQYVEFKIVSKHENMLQFDASNNIIGMINHATDKKINFIAYEHTIPEFDITIPSNIPLKIEKIETSLVSEKLCAITCDDFELNDRYLQCRRCKKPFTLDAMIRWLKINFSCPMCKQKWTKTDNIYVNSNITFIHEVRTVNKPKDIRIKQRNIQIQNMRNTFDNLINDYHR